MQTTKLTNIQQELLKIFSVNIDEKELHEVKGLLADYFSSKALNKADEIWEKRGYTEKTMDDILNDKNQ